MDYFRNPHPAEMAEARLERAKQSFLAALVELIESADAVEMSQCPVLEISLHCTGGETLDSVTPTLVSSSWHQVKSTSWREITSEGGVIIHGKAIEMGIPRIMGDESMRMVEVFFNGERAIEEARAWLKGNFDIDAPDDLF